MALVPSPQDCNRCVLLAPPKPIAVQSVESVRAETVVAQTAVIPRITTFKLRFNGTSSNQRFTTLPDQDREGLNTYRNSADPSACPVTNIITRLDTSFSGPVGFKAGWNSPMHLGTSINPDHLVLGTDGSTKISSKKPDIVFDNQDGNVWSLNDRLTALEMGLARISSGKLRIIDFNNGHVSSISIEPRDSGSMIIHNGSTNLTARLPSEMPLGSIITFIQASSGCIVFDAAELLCEGDRTLRVGDCVKAIALSSSQIGDNPPCKWIVVR